MSPGLRSGRCSVAGTTVPAFVERPWHRGSRPSLRTMEVSRDYGPVSPGLRSRPSLSVSRYVVPRRPSLSDAGTAPAVSPGLRSRPSLSGQAMRIQLPTGVRRCRVAGTTVPAFVERCRKQGSFLLSPGLHAVLRSRPSLSGRGQRCRDRLVEPGVAGTTVPAFVERSRDRRRRAAASLRGVAGTTVPAFVERTGISFTRFEGSHR